mmetsp:Transcript_21167/g.51632  ORF Transcript_21167/g.51632 Transcript_21167/m.51632 type:complete len:200 (+) Transcript_21167:768-1367(+)
MRFRSQVHHMVPVDEPRGFAVQAQHPPGGQQAREPLLAARKHPHQKRRVGRTRSVCVLNVESRQILPDERRPRHYPLTQRPDLHHQGGEAAPLLPHSRAHRPEAEVELHRVLVQAGAAPQTVQPSRFFHQNRTSVRQCCHRLPQAERTPRSRFAVCGRSPDAFQLGLGVRPHRRSHGLRTNHRREGLLDTSWCGGAASG